MGLGSGKRSSVRIRDLLRCRRSCLTRRKNLYPIKRLASRGYSPNVHSLPSQWKASPAKRIGASQQGETTGWPGADSSSEQGATDHSNNQIRRAPFGSTTQPRPTCTRRASQPEARQEYPGGLRNPSHCQKKKKGFAARAPTQHEGGHRQIRPRTQSNNEHEKGPSIPDDDNT